MPSEPPDSNARPTVIPGGDPPGTYAPGTYAQVVETLLDLQRRLRDERSRRSARPLRVIGRPARDDLVVVDDVDLTVVGAGDDPIPDERAEVERLAALTERLRALEDDLGGIYETVGRFAEDADAARSASLAQVRRVEERLEAIAGELRTAAAAASDEPNDRDRER